MGLSLALSCCSPAPRPPNVLLITLDTTRADRLGCYGRVEALTPALDALAASGIRFEHAYAQVPLTLASHTSLLTGTYPRVNGVHVNAAGGLGVALPTLAELLRARGYRTAAFVSSFVLDAVFGLDRGFEVYDDRMGEPDRSERFEVERRADQVAGAALEWIARQNDQPFFAWVHFYDPHSPYDPPEEYAQRLADPYDAEIAFVDSQVRRLLDSLEASGQRERTLVVVAGDHGEAFGEHGESEHGLFVYDTTVHVPLILSWPGQLPAGESLQAAVQLVDVLPTVAELTGAGPDPESDGTSLVALVRGGGSEGRTIYGESRYGQIGFGWAPLRYVIESGWKYIEAPHPELYDLGADPEERNNLVLRRAELARTLRTDLLALEARRLPIDGEPVELDADARARIESLGYVGGSSAPASEDDSALEELPDPKDMAGVMREFQRAIGLVRQRRFAEALVPLEEVVRRSPESYDVYEKLGWCYLSLGRLEDAERAYEKSLTRLPDHPERLWGLAETQRRRNELEPAIANFRRALDGRPALGEAHMGLALTYAALGDYSQAYEHACRHAEINPASTIAQLNVLNLAMELGKFDEAATAADRLVALDPSNPEAYLSRAAVLRRAGRRDDEITALRAAHDAVPEDWRITRLLAWVLATTQGRSPVELDEALEVARRAVEMQPQDPLSYDTLAAALAARGSFAQATEAARRASALAGDPSSSGLRSEIRSRLALYQAGKPYLE